MSVTLDGSPNDGGASDDNGSRRDNVGTDLENITTGTGSDTLSGSPATNVLIGNDGNDTLVGFGGDNVLQGRVAMTASRLSTERTTCTAARATTRWTAVPETTCWSPDIGADDLIGGPGTDVATYITHQEALSLTIDGAANDGGLSDGSGGRRDNIGTDIENLVGGSGRTRLPATRDNILDGSGSDDFLDGATGADDLIGGAGGGDRAFYGNRGSRRHRNAAGR